MDVQQQAEAKIETFPYSQYGAFIRHNREFNAGNSAREW